MSKDLIQDEQSKSALPTLMLPERNSTVTNKYLPSILPIEEESETKSSELNENDPKLWTNKITPAEYLKSIIYNTRSANADFINAVEEIFNNILQRYQIPLDSDYVKKIKEECEKFKELSRPRKVIGFAGIRELAKNVDESRQNIIDIISSRQDDFDNAVNTVILYEKVADVLGNKIDAFIVWNESEKIGETAIIFDEPTNLFQLKYNSLAESNNFLGVLQNNYHLSKPLKGVFRSAIIQLFLMSPVELDDMRICKESDVVSNIKFFKAFTEDQNEFLKTPITADRLLQLMTKDNSAFYNRLKEKCDESEINETVLIIANLQDEDLEFLVDGIAQIKYGDGKELVPKDTRNQYLETLKSNRDFFASYGLTIEDLNPIIEQKDPDLPNTKPVYPEQTLPKINDQDLTFKPMRPPSQSLAAHEEERKRKYQPKLEAKLEAERKEVENQNNNNVVADLVFTGWGDSAGEDEGDLNSENKSADSFSPGQYSSADERGSVSSEQYLTANDLNSDSDTDFSEGDESESIPENPERPSTNFLPIASTPLAMHLETSKAIR